MRVEQLTTHTPSRSALLLICLVVVTSAQLVGAGKSPMTILKYDPTAQRMEMFAALEAGALSVRVVAHDATGGNMYFENLTTKPMTVELPAALTIVHVLKQFGGGGFGGGGFGGQQGGLGGQQGGFGGGQSGGGGFGQQGGQFGGGGGFGQQGGGGGGFFSIPAERVARVPYQSVCLNYGKPDPSPRMTYQPVRLEEFSQDKVLQETLRIFGTGQLDQTSAQAAAWHLTYKLSWDQLAHLKRYTLPGVHSSQVPIFSVSQLQTAQRLVAVATQRAAEHAREAQHPAPRTSPGKSGL